MTTLTTQQIADHVHGTLIGPGDLLIRGIEVLSRAKADQLSFVRTAQFAEQWPQSQAGVALISRQIEMPDVSKCPGRAMIRVEDADMALNLVIELFAPAKSTATSQIHPSALIDPTATLGADVTIGPYCVVGAHVQLGAGCVLHENVILGEHTSLGKNCQLYGGVVVRERCLLGDRVVLHANAVIGADGFGYRPAENGQGVVKVPHIGTVRIGNDVEIGAGTCIDRGKFSATLIGEGTKIDNLCQVAHNCEIGRCCLIAAQTGIAGSTVIGDGVMIGGQTGIRDNIRIGSGVRLAACSAVMRDIPDGETWLGYPAQEQSIAKREYVATRQLPEVIKAYKQFTREIGQ